VRELVFYVALRAILPTHIKNQFGANRATLNAYLQFLPLLLRIWTIIGELILWSAASVIDLPGALDKPNAPGRAPMAPRQDSPPEDRSERSTDAGAAASPS